MNENLSGTTSDRHIARAVTNLRDRYRRRADRGVLFFRASGIVLVSIGGFIPVLAVADYPHKAVVLAATGVMMSLATSLHTFFRWDRQWQILREAQFRLENSHLEWLLRTSEAQSLPEEQRHLCLAEANRNLLEQYRSIRAEEASGFFSLLQFPHRTDEDIPSK